METRALIAFVLSISILVGYQLLLGPRSDVPADPAATVAQPPVQPVSSPGTPLPAAVSGVAQPKTSADEERITIERDLYRLVVTSAGGRLESFRLNAYREDSSPESPALEMVDSGDVLPLGVYWTRPDGAVARLIYKNPA